MTPLKRLIQRTVGFNPVAWVRARRVMAARVTEYLSHIGEAAGSPSTVVVVSPWQGTAVPWFTLGIGLMMAERGARVEFVVDDLPYGGNAIRHAIILRAIRYVMQRVSGRFEVRYLSASTPAVLTEDDRAEIERLARLNATWTLRGEMPEKGRAGLIARETRQNSLAQQHIAGLLREMREPEFLFTPGGVFGHSGLWMREARNRGIRIGSFDAGAHQAMLIASDGMACQLRDIPRAFRQLRREWESDADGLNHAMRRAEEELAKRRAGKDKFTSQVANSGAGASELEGGVLIALNSSWDAAALGPHRAFETNTQWIVGTARYLLENTSRPVIVRQHPVERLAIAATSEDYAMILRREFGDHPRLHFIAASDPINSYALMEKVLAVVVHTSTLGMEAAAFGCPVITGSLSYYAELGFVEYADNREGYERLLQAAADGTLAVTETMRRDAMLCYYVTQCCNWVFSPFHPANFTEWAGQPLHHWSNTPTVSRMVDALMSGDPIATLNHKVAVQAKAAT